MLICFLFQIFLKEKMTQVDITNHIVSDEKLKPKCNMKKADVNDIDVVSCEEFREKSFRQNSKREDIICNRTQNISQVHQSEMPSKGFFKYSFHLHRWMKCYFMMAKCPSVCLKEA